MANLKSSKEVLQQAKNNLNPELQNIENTNNAVLSEIKEQKNSINQLKQSLVTKEAIEKDGIESINNSLRSSISYLTSISGKLSVIQTNVSSLKGTLTSVTKDTDVTISLLGSIKTSLVQITGLLSAFRADYIMANNGITINGESAIDTGLLIKDLSILSSYKNKSLKNSIKYIRDATKFADLMSNAVRPRVGNNRLAGVHGGEGLFSRLLGKFLPEDYKDIASPILQMLPMFGIDDSNIKNLATSILNKKDPNASKKFIDPLNQAITDILNEPDDASGKGIFKKFLAGKFADITGFGDAKTKNKESDPNLVLSALAPLADDIKDMVKSKYEAISKRPNIIPIYATPVWVVNSKYQENGLEKSIKTKKQLKNSGTRGDKFLQNRVKSAIRGTTNNKKDENGEDLWYVDPYTGEISGKLVEKYLKSKGKQDSSYDDKYRTVQSKINKELEEDKKQKSTSKYTYMDETGRYQQGEIQNIYKTIMDSDSELADYITRIANGDIQTVFELGGKLIHKDSRSNFFRKVGSDFKSTKSNISKARSELKGAKDKERRVEYFSNILKRKLIDYLGLGLAFDTNFENDFESICNVIYNEVNFENENTIKDSLEKNKETIMNSIEAIFGRENISTIFGFVEQSAVECVNQTSKGEKQAKKEYNQKIKDFKKQNKKGHKQGRSALGQDTSEKEVRALSPDETVVSANNVSKNNTEDDITGASFVLASGITSLTVIESQMVHFLGQAVNQGEIEGKIKKIPNPFNLINSLFNKSSIRNKKIGGPVNKAIEENSKASDLSKFISKKNKKHEKEKHLKMKDIWGENEENNEENNEDENKEKENKNKTALEKLKEKITGKLKVVGERIDLAKRRLKKTKLGRAYEFIKDPTKKLREKVNKFGEKISNRIEGTIENAAMNLGKSALNKVKNSKVGKLTKKGFAKVSKTKVGSKAINFTKNLFAAETEAEKREREETEKLAKMNEEEKKAYLEEKARKEKAEKENMDKESKNVDENIKEDQKNAEEINKQNLDATKENNKTEEKNLENLEKLKDKNEKNLSKIEEKGEKQRQDLEDNQANIENQIKTTTAVEGATVELVGAQGAAESDTSSSKILAIAKGSAKMLLIGGAVASAISLIRSLAKGKKNKGGGKDAGGGSSASASKDEQKELKKAKKEAEKEKKKKEKEERKKERNERVKRGLKTLVNASPLGFFTREKVYIAENGDVLKVKGNEPVKSVKKGLETEENLNVKTKKGKLEFAKRIVQKEFKLVKNPQKVKEQKEKIKENIKDLGIEAFNAIKNPLGFIAKTGGKVISKFFKKNNRRKVKISESGEIIDAVTNEPIKTKDGQFILKNSSEEWEERKEKDLILEGESKKDGLVSSIKNISKVVLSKIVNKIDDNKKSKMMQIMMVAMAPILFMGNKMKKKLEEFSKSSLGQMMLVKPEYASNILFNLSPASTTLSVAKNSSKLGINLKSIGQSTLDKLGGVLSDLFGKTVKLTKGSLSQDLSSGTFKENATIANAQSQSREISNRTVDAFMKSLNLGESKSSENDTLWTTSKVVDAERKKNAIHVGVVGGGTGVAGSSVGGGNVASLVYAAAEVCKAYKDAQGSFAYSNGSSVQLKFADGQTISQRPDCSGYMSAIINRMGYTLSPSSNGTFCTYGDTGMNTVTDSSSTQPPIYKNGQLSTDWVFVTGGKDRSNLQTGDIVFRSSAWLSKRGDGHTGMFVSWRDDGQYMAGFDYGCEDSMTDSLTLAEYILSNGGNLPTSFPKGMGYCSLGNDDERADRILRYVGGNVTGTSTATASEGDKTAENITNNSSNNGNSSNGSGGGGNGRIATGSNQIKQPSSTSNSSNGSGGEGNSRGDSTTGKGKKYYINGKANSNKNNSKLNPNHIFQRDYSYISYNTPGDSECQTLGDSGCGPAAAATVKKYFNNKDKSIKYGKGRWGGDKETTDDKGTKKTTTTTTDDSSTSKNSSSANVSNNQGSALGKEASRTDSFGRTYTLKITQDEIDVFNALKQIGCSDAAACGAIGNFQQECGVNNLRATAEKGIIRYGGGLMQWTDSGNGNPHLNWIASHPEYKSNPWSWEANLAHLQDEINTSGNFNNPKNANPSFASKGLNPVSSREEFKALNDPKDAAANFERIFEVSGDWNGGNSEGVNYKDYQLYDNVRIQYAILAYEMLVGTYDGSSVVGSASASMGGNLALTGWVDLVADSYVGGDVLKDYMNNDTENIWDTYNNNLESANSSDDSSTAEASGEDSTSNNSSSTASPSNGSSTSGTTNGSSSTGSVTTPSNGSITTPSNGSSTSGTTNGSSSTGSVSNPSNNNSSNNSSTIDNSLTSDVSNSVTLTKSGNNVVVSSNGKNTIVICNNFSEKTKTNLDDIVSNFDHLNDTQGKALKILKAISELIKEDGDSPAPNLHLNNEGLDLILKGI